MCVHTLSKTRCTSVRGEVFVCVCVRSRGREGKSKREEGASESGIPLIAAAPCLLAFC